MLDTDNPFGPPAPVVYGPQPATILDVEAYSDALRVSCAFARNARVQNLRANFTVEQLQTMYRGALLSRRPRALDGAGSLF